MIDRIEGLSSEDWAALPEADKRQILLALEACLDAHPFPLERWYPRLWEILQLRSFLNIDCEEVLDRLEALGEPCPPPRVWIALVRVFRLAAQAGDAESIRQAAPLLDRLAYGGRYGCVPEGAAPSFPYRPSPAERRLIARALGLCLREGWLPGPVPEIVASWEVPPLLLAYPELDGPEPWPAGIPERPPPGEREPDGERDRKLEIPPDSDLPAPESVDIEMLLGYYVAEERRVVLLERGFRKLRERYDTDVLRAVVLVHEMAHWMMHAMPGADGRTWPLDGYQATEADLHETWAQWVTWQVAEAVGGPFRRTFEALNQHQSARYRLFLKLRRTAPRRVVAAVGALRAAGKPATFAALRRRLGLRT